MAAKRRSLEATLQALAAARTQPLTDETVALLRRAIRGRSSHAAAKAAEVAGELSADALAPELLAAFDRFMQQPTKSDPGCAAKEAIVDALQQLGIPASEVFHQGIAHRQMEPVWGGRVDTAARLRGLCGFGLARIRDARTMTELASLLADEEPEARRMAAQALAYNGDLSAVPLLRFKALVGDDEADVLTESMRGLLELAPDESISFVESFLDEQRGVVAESAALALGGSRIEQAFPILRAWWDRVAHPDLKSSAALALAMLRRESSIDFLLDILSADSALEARHALKALAIYRHDDRLCDRVECAVRGSGNDSIAKEFVRLFDR